MTEKLICFFILFFFGGKMSEELKKIVKTSISIPVDLWRDIKIYAAKKGLKLTQVVEAALRKYIELTEGEE